MLPDRRAPLAEALGTARGLSVGWLLLAPLAAAICTLASWAHYWLTGSLRLQAFPRGTVLEWTAFVAALGLLLLGACCVAVYRRVEERDLERVRNSALLVHAVMLLALPLYSSDLFTYLAYGELGARGMSPHLVGPAALGDSPLLELTTWHGMPSAYGPVSNLLSLIAAYIGQWTGSPLWIAGISYKALTGLIDFTGLLVLFGLVRRSASPVLVRGFALYALNPLLAWEVAGQAHNDVLVVVFAVVALWAIQRQREGLTILALVGGALSKFVLAPSAAFQLVAIARKDLWRAARLGLLAVAIGVGCYLPRVLSSPDLASLLPPLRTDDFGSLLRIINGVLRFVDAAPETFAGARVAYVWAGRVVLIVVAFALLWSVRSTEDVPRASLLMTLAIISTTSVLEPWYLTWLIPFAAVEADRRYQRLVLALTLCAAPSMGLWRMYLVLPLCQVIGLITLLLWFERHVLSSLRLQGGTKHVMSSVEPEA